jgi:hypothetical protein
MMMPPISTARRAPNILSASQPPGNGKYHTDET